MAATSGSGTGTLLLADISGYTAFLQAVAEAHAEDLRAGRFVPEAYPLLTSLLDGVVDRIAPPFEVSEVEGDAVFAFAAEGSLALRGPSVSAFLAGCYQAYRARLQTAMDGMPSTPNWAFHRLAGCPPPRDVRSRPGPTTSRRGSSTRPTAPKTGVWWAMEPARTSGPGRSRPARDSCMRSATWPASNSATRTS